MQANPAPSATSPEILVISGLFIFCATIRATNFEGFSRHFFHHSLFPLEDNGIIYIAFSVQYKAYTDI